jgi:surfactin family lipopeptide synthetase B
MTQSNAQELPQGALEQTIAQMWQEVFHLERVRRDDNFFELGGDSVLGMTLSEMFTTRLQLHVPIVTIFQYPTIRQMAQAVAEATA